MCRCTGWMRTPRRSLRPRTRHLHQRGGKMFDDSNIIVGLEIGTSKVCAVVGEQAADGSLNIIGLGQARSRGVRKGEIVDPKQAEEDVRNAIVGAESMSGAEISNVRSEER